MAVDPKKLQALAPKQPDAPKKGDEQDPDGTPDVKAIIKQVDDDGKADPKLKQLIKSYDPDSGEEPNFVADDDLWGQATDLVEPYFDELVEPYLVILTVYREMGGKFVDEPDDDDDADDDEDDAPTGKGGAKPGADDDVDDGDGGS